LICGQTLSVPKTHDVKCCYENHLSKYNKHKEQLQGNKLQDFKSATMCANECTVHKDYEATVKASHVTAKPFTENSKCFSDSEFVNRLHQ
jgi:hypothetical protein